MKKEEKNFVHKKRSIYSERKWSRAILHGASSENWRCSLWLRLGSRESVLNVKAWEVLFGFRKTARLLAYGAVEVIKNPEDQNSNSEPKW